MNPPKVLTSISSIPLEQLFQQLQSGEQGLGETLAKQRIKEQKKYTKKTTRFQREFKLFIRQFFNPLIMILAIVVILSAILGQKSDTIIILFIIFITGILGFFQEVNAGRAAEKLLAMIEITHQVVREGTTTTVNTAEVVPGDILLLDAGDIIPADCRIIESNELHVDESSLTGESYPVEKVAGVIPEDAPLNKKQNCLWAGTHVITGTARVLVVHTAANTIFGQIAAGIFEVSITAFEQGITKFGYFLLKITVLLSVFILLTNLYFGKPFFNALLFSLALAIGMAPELLPAIMTFTMSVGAKRMLQKKVIVKKLSSIFNFGEVNVLCIDKTGTITEGLVRLKDIVNVSGKPDQKAKFYAFLNSYFENGFSNPIDNVIRSLKLDVNGYEKKDEIPYDFIRKCLSISVKHKDEQLLITKGAVMNVLSLCNYFQTESDQLQLLTKSSFKKIETAFIKYSEEGLRVLGVGYKTLDKEKITRDDEKDMVFIGFILLEDPLKGTSCDAIARLEQMHVSVKMITGDNRYAALHAARQIKISNPKLITGEQLNKMSPAALVVNVRKTDVFAEIEPHQKERIVQSLQKAGLTVAYLGDGINDVAAIHAADTGISTNNAVDIAKEAADFVLLEKDLAVLADGVHEGRKSFANSMKYIFINTGSVFGNMFSVAGASLILPFLPMLPKQILLTNLITDFPYLAIASDHVDAVEIKKTLKWNIKQIRKFMILFGLHSSIFDFITFYTLFYFFKSKEASFQTGWFIESIITQLVIVFIVRTKKSILKSKPAKSLFLINVFALLITAWLPVSPFAASVGLTIIHVRQVVAIILISFSYMVTAELLKIWFFKRVGKDA